MSQLGEDSTERPAAPRPGIPESITISFNSRRLIQLLIAFALFSELFFLVIDYHVNYGGTETIGALRRLSNLAREDSLAAWFATTQTLMIALTLWLIYLCTRHAVGTEAPRWLRVGWVVLAGFFSYMVVDDGSQLHERMGTLFSRMNPRGRDSAETWITQLLDVFPSYYWQLLFLPLFGAMALFILFFLWRVLDRRSIVIVALAITCFVVAVGLDFVEGLSQRHPYNLNSMIAKGLDMEEFTRARFDESAYDTVRHFQKAIEETIEMLGNTLLWFVFLGHLCRVATDLRVRFVHR